MNKYGYMRNEAGYSLREMAVEAKAAGIQITPPMLCDVETGKAKPSVDVLRAYYSICK